MRIYIKKEMTKILFFTFCLSLLAACKRGVAENRAILVVSEPVGQQTGKALKDSTTRNEEFIRRYFEQVWNQQDLQVIEELTPEPFVLHYQGKPITASHEEHKDVVSYWLNAFPDYRVNLHDVLSDEDKVVARYTFTGTHKDSVLGIPPTGKEVKVTGIWICRVENSLLIECWEEYDEQGLVRQLQKK